MGGLFSSPKAPTPPPPVTPTVTQDEASFKPGDDGEKRTKKLTAIKKGKGRLAIAAKTGVKSGVKKGY